MINITSLNVPTTDIQLGDYFVKYYERCTTVDGGHYLVRSLTCEKYNSFKHIGIYTRDNNTYPPEEVNISCIDIEDASIYMDVLIFGYEITIRLPIISTYLGRAKKHILLLSAIKSLSYDRETDQNNKPYYMYPFDSTTPEKLYVQLDDGEYKIYTKDNNSLIENGYVQIIDESIVLGEIGGRRISQKGVKIKKKRRKRKNRKQS